MAHIFVKSDNLRLQVEEQTHVARPQLEQDQFRTW